MAATAGSELEQYQEILTSASKLPSSLRLSLAQAILRTLELDLGKGTRKKMPASEALGLLAGPYPAPSDNEVKQMITDYLSEKYG